ncbi:hypothetical protein NAS2_0680 [Conexivisphaera calida]|uniref:Uncharacterized protein n=1 Tax=Conexivisphaera calida TaxID=1874277 RepID=A0A4P2VC00_9ARCH|nr:hypothetical protein NAS2_0680 [Conexivisphaera calida]
MVPVVRRGDRFYYEVRGAEDGKEYYIDADVRVDRGPDGHETLYALTYRDDGTRWLVRVPDSVINAKMRRVFYIITLPDYGVGMAVAYTEEYVYYHRLQIEYIGPDRFSRAPFVMVRRGSPESDPVPVFLGTLAGEGFNISQKKMETNRSKWLRRIAKVLLGVTLIPTLITGGGAAIASAIGLGVAFGYGSGDLSGVLLGAGYFITLATGVVLYFGSKAAQRTVWVVEPDDEYLLAHADSEEARTAPNPVVYT